MKIIDKREEVKSQALGFIENLVESVYIIGTNKYGISIATWLAEQDKKVLGYINDFSLEKLFNNLPVIKSNYDFSSAAIINCVVEGRTMDVQKLIEATNAVKSIDYFKLQFAFSGQLLPIDFLVNTNSVLSQRKEYDRLYTLLADDQSKQELEALINFRLNRDIGFLDKFQFRIQEQYFEPFVKLPPAPSFVDGGGFDGSTSLEFQKIYPDYNKIFYFEPNEGSMSLSKQRLFCSDARVEFFQKGLWSRNDTLCFEDDLGSASKLSNQGKVFIETTSIDAEVKEKIDFIKLDIEGAETEALIGSSQLIKKYKPQMAVCVYHNQQHFIEVPNLILKYNSLYRIYLRHYTQGVFETVMYFV